MDDVRQWPLAPYHREFASAEITLMSALLHRGITPDARCIPRRLFGQDDRPFGTATEASRWSGRQMNALAGDTFPRRT